MMFGHDAAQGAFADGLRAGRLHHAWLLTGSPGVGKASLAFRMARQLLSPDADPNDPANPVFRRIAHGSHADVLTIERETDQKTKKLRREVAVDQVRDVAGFLHLTPAEGGWRVVVVDGVETLNRNAANALLKVLEEPPRRAILLMTADAPGRLLPTIRSRCRQLRLDGLAPPEMHDALQVLLPDLDEDTRSALMVLGDGSPGRAVALASEGAVVLSGMVRDVLATPSLSVSRMYEVAERVTRTEGGFETFMALLQAGVADAVRGAARSGAAALVRRPLAEWGEVWHALGHLQNETERFNLDRRNAVVSGLQLLTKAEQLQ